MKSRSIRTILFLVLVLVCPTITFARGDNPRVYPSARYESHKPAGVNRDPGVHAVARFIRRPPVTRETVQKPVQVVWRQGNKPMGSQLAIAPLFTRTPFRSIEAHWGG